MKLHEKQNRFGTNIQSVPSQFKIQASEKAFRILSNNLYSDKIRAIIRELSTNAHDAHIFSGKEDIPFEVKLPNPEEPWFEVKDFGPGLCEEDIYNLYTTYFDSDKTESNSYVGALGLGSKSPFSYTDSFNVASRHGGKELFYTCFLDKSGIPSVMEISRREMGKDEYNGITVSVPIQKRDFTDFYFKSQIIFRPFGVKPVIKGKEDMTIHGYGGTEVTSLNTISLYSSSPNVYSPHNNITIKYGCVEYEMEHNGDKDIRNFIESFRRIGYLGVIDVPLGLLEISPSRESLSYDPETVKNLKRIIQKAVYEIRDWYIDSIRNFETDWERNLFLYKSSEIGSFLKSNIETGFREVIKGLFDSPEVFDNLHEKGTIKSDEAFLLLPKRRNNNINIFRRKIFSFPDILMSSESIEVVYQPKGTERKVISNLRNYIRNNHHSHRHYTAYLVVEKYELIKKLGNPRFTRISDISQQEKPERENNPGKMVYVKDNGWSQYDSLEESDIVYVYVVKGQGYSYSSGGEDLAYNINPVCVSSKINYFLKYLREISKLSQNKRYIPVIIKSYLSKKKAFSGDRRFVPFMNVLEITSRYARKYFEASNNSSYQLAVPVENESGTITTYDKNINEVMKALLSIDKLRSTGFISLIKKAVEGFGEISDKENLGYKERELGRAIVDATRRFVPQTPRMADYSFLKDTVLEIQSNYPMFFYFIATSGIRYELMRSSISELNIDCLLEYINLVERCKGDEK